MSVAQIAYADLAGLEAGIQLSTQTTSLLAVVAIMMKRYA